MTSKVDGPIIKQSSDHTRDKKTTYEAIMYRLTQYMKESATPEGSAYLSDCKENKKEESIRWKDLWPAPPKLEDTLTEVQDPLLEVNLGIGHENQLTYIGQLLSQEQHDQLVGLLT